MKNIVLGDFKDTGVNTIDIDLVVSKWNHLWVLIEWERDNSWRLVKYLRKDSPITNFKLTISPEQAKDLILKLDLISSNSGIFNSGFSWRTKKDMIKLKIW
jgi:hypothetical protein